MFFLPAAMIMNYLLDNYLSLISVKIYLSISKKMGGKWKKVTFDNQSK